MLLSGLLFGLLLVFVCWLRHSRVTSKDIRPQSLDNDREGLFAATPPLELVKMITMRAARHSNSTRRRTGAFVDIGTAHLHAPVPEEAYADLPPEEAQAGTCARWLCICFCDVDVCKHMEAGYSWTLEHAGFVVGRVMRRFLPLRPERSVRIVVHREDFVVEGEGEDLEWVMSVLEAKYIVSVRGVEKDEICMEILKKGC